MMPDWTAISTRVTQIIEVLHLGDEPLASMGAIDRGRIPLSQTISDHIDYPANHTPVVHARNATRPREKGFNALKLSLSQREMIRHRQVPPAAFES